MKIDDSFKFSVKEMSVVQFNIHDLFRACEIGDRKSVERFLLSGVQIDTPDEDNLTALQVAAANDQVFPTEREFKEEINVLE